MSRPASAQRRLTAVLCADVVGYSRLMQDDEQATHEALTRRRRLFEERAGAHAGRIVNAPGDSILAEFPSVLEAVQCALEVQRALIGLDEGAAAGRRMQFRIGVNLGDVLVDPEGIYGDGVNIAARLEGLCEPGAVAISGSVFEQLRDRAGLRFIDRGEHAVKNIARPVRVYCVQEAGGAATRRRVRIPRAMRVAGVLLVLAALLAALGPPLARRMQKPAGDSAATIAVLPFANQSGDASRDYFSAGLTEDVTSALGRFSGLRVMSYSAVLPYRRSNATPQQVSRELGVRYVIQGGVREAGGRLRVGVELSDGSAGTLLWSERYEGEGAQVFDIQDRIVRNVVGALAVKLTALEQQRTLAKPPGSLEAYDLVLRARALLAQADRAANRQARALTARAIELSPDYAEAYAAASYGEFQRASFGWIEDPREALARSEEAARRAIALGEPGAAARAYGVLGNLHTFKGEFDAAMQDANRALELNPSDALAYALRGGILLWTGHLEESIAATEAARRFDPGLSSEAAFNLALAYYLAGRYRDAVVLTEGMRTAQPGLVFSEAVRAAALAQLGERVQAQRAADEVRRLNPFFAVDRFGTRLVNLEQRAKIQEGLHKAGL